MINVNILITHYQALKLFLFHLFNFHFHKLPQSQRLQ